MSHRFSTYSLLLLAVGVFASATAHGAKERAFPGAEGFGGSVKGGTGGRVIWVTNLNSRGPGSLRAAVDAFGPRIVKFKVGGTIELWRDMLRIGWGDRPRYKKLIKQGKRPSEIENRCSYLTIDGAGAPPPGITLSGNIDMRYGIKEVIIRHIRVRDNGFVHRATQCILVAGHHVLIDHCSLQWARDEVLTAWHETAHDITAQWCIIGPGWGHLHGFGLLTGGGTDRITVHHCLLANNLGRNPLLCGNSRTSWVGKYPNDTPVFDFRNNVIYNWLVNQGAVITAGAHANLVGNRFIPGPDSSKGGPVIKPTCRYHTNPTVLYLKGNISMNRPRDDMEEWADAGHIAKVKGKWRLISGPTEWGRKRETPFPVPSVVTHSADEAKALVLSQVGAWPRDPVDAGLIRTVLHGTGWAGSKNTIPADFTNARPSAKAIASPAGRGNPLAVRFQGEGRDTDGKIILHTWHFGDGHRAVGGNVTHTYASAGEYVATLFAVDDQGMSQTASLRITVGKDQFKHVPRRALSRRAQASGFVGAKPHGRTRPAVPQPWKPPTVNVPAALTAPPTEKDWRSAPRLAPFIDLGTLKKAPEGMFDARMLHDEENLYLRICAMAGLSRRAWAGRLKRINSFTAPRRGRKYELCNDIPQPVIFVSPQHGKAPWYSFRVSRGGGGRDTKGPDRNWNASPDWRIMSKEVAGKWQLTFAIPFKALAAVPQKAQVWGLKMIFYTAKDVIHIWPPVGPAGKDLYCAPQSSDPIYYAKLRFP